MNKLSFLAIILSFSIVSHAQAPGRKAASSVKKKPGATARKLTEKLLPQPTPLPADPAAEKARLDEAVAKVTPAEKVAAIQEFLRLYPATGQKLPAYESLTGARAALGDEKLAAGETDAGAALFRVALSEAPKPYSDRFFAEVVSRIPANLIFRGMRAEAFEAAAAIEQNIGSNVNQLLSVANFYLSIENGDEAKRIADASLKINSGSAGAHLVLGHAQRLNFDLEAAANSYTKALELDGEMLVAKRALADMKRALGKPDAAAELYRELIATSETDQQARTGLVLSLFDAGKKGDAETEMAKALEAGSGNVVLLAGAAYWYASQNDGSKAVEYGQKAVEAEPRYIWSHIALAHGLIAQRKPLDAERVLTGARKYGNFPTLEYEIANARLNSGLYREAALELAKSFVVTNGSVETRLGGRVTRREKSFPELVAFERRASIFEPAGVDVSENAERLKALLDFAQKIDAPAPNENDLTAAADEFIRGDDKMKLHRQLYVANALLQKRIALSKVLELTKSATGNTDAALETPLAAAVVMADELYESRALAFSRDDYLLVPDVPKQTLSAILRGRIEEITGWALYNQNNYPDAVIRLKRAVSVYPEKSAWMRSGKWRLGAALEADGKDRDALDAYIESYKTDKPDVVKYVVVENLYRKMNGTLDGLEAVIGPNPLPPVAASPVPAASVPVTDTSDLKPVIAIPAPIPAAAESKAETVTTETSKSAPPPVEAKTELPASSVVAEPTAIEPSLELPKVQAPEVVAPTTNDPPPTLPETKTQEPPAEKDADVTAPVQPVTNEDKAKEVPAETQEPIPASVTEPVSPAQPVSSPEAEVETAKPSETASKSNAAPAGRPLFEPIIITIPATAAPKKRVAEAESKQADAGRIEPEKVTAPDPANSGEVRPRVIEGAEDNGDVAADCTLNMSDESVSVINDGGSVGILITVKGNTQTKIDAATSSPDDIDVKPDPEFSNRGPRRFYIIKSVSTAVGLYDVNFTAPCDSAAIKVRVR